MKWVIALLCTFICAILSYLVTANLRGETGTPLTSAQTAPELSAPTDRSGGRHFEQADRLAVDDQLDFTRIEGAESSPADPSPEERAIELIEQLLGTEGLLGLSEQEQEAHFKWLRENAPEHSISDEAKTLRSAIMEATATAIRNRVSTGEYALVNTDADGVISLKNEHVRERVQFYHFLPSGQVAKIELPETNFPLQYQAQQRINWLEDILLERRASKATVDRKYQVVEEQDENR